MGALTQDEKDAIRDAGVAQWWKDWYAADYSWEGLTQYPWQGWMVVVDEAAYRDYIKTHGLPKGCPNEACRVVPDDYDGLPDDTETRPATLQDYWRDQEHGLEVGEWNKKYTLAHVPIIHEGGKESWKADPDHHNWKVLSELAKERLVSGVETEVIFKTGEERVFGPDGRANFQGCVLPSLPNRIERLVSRNPTDKTSVFSSKKGSLLHLSLVQAAIVQPQDFSESIFSTSANFTKSAFMAGDVKFYRTEFLGQDVRFIDTLFCGGNTSFSNTDFSCGCANFSNAKFLGGNTIFRNSRFSKEGANFTKAQFSGGYVDFCKASFLQGDVSFSRAIFSGGDVNFSDAEFFCNALNFYNTVFSGGNVSFIRTRFRNTFKFHGAEFFKSVSFENSVFPSAKHSYNSFRSTQFFGPVKFNRTRRIFDVSTMPSSSDLHFPFNAFGLANFRSQLILTQRGDRAAQIEFNCALKSTAKACQNEQEETVEAHYVALESGCTTLKRAMESVSDKNRAQRYFKFELQARQRRPSTPFLVKLFTRLYGLTADYGGSIWKPLASLGFLWVGFALFHCYNAERAGVDLSTAKIIWGAMDFSATHIFRPLFIWSKTEMGDAQGWLAQYRAGLSAGGWLSIKLLATLQSFLSLTLLFLFGLATKRKFQIS